MNIWSEKSQVKFASTRIYKDELFNFSMKKETSNLMLLNRAKIWTFCRNFPPKWPNFAIQNVVECPVQRKFVSRRSSLPQISYDCREAAAALESFVVQLRDCNLTSYHQSFSDRTFNSTPGKR
jgi:hypothetical protein